MVKRKSNYEMVYEFHEAFGAKVGDDSRPGFCNADDSALRLKLIQEEFREVSEEIEKGDNPVNIVKELVDLLYVVYGTGVTMGIDLDEAFRIVHESNMTKLGEDGKPIYREDGKVLKGPNYKPADLTILFKEK